MQNRKCDGCTECCRGYFYPNVGEGWWNKKTPDSKPTPAIVDGNPLGFRQCAFVSDNGCTIHETKPESPCKRYECGWLKNSNIPEEFKPNKSKVIITEKVKVQDDGSKSLFWDVTECGQKIDAEILNWILIYSEKNNIPLKYRINGKEYRKLGSIDKEQIRKGQLNVSWGDYW
jgi:hypothetical protein